MVRKVAEVLCYCRAIPPDHCERPTWPSSNPFYSTPTLFYWPWGGGCHSLPASRHPPPPCLGGKSMCSGAASSTTTDFQMMPFTRLEYKSLSSCLAHWPAPEVGERVVTRGVLGIRLGSSLALGTVWYTACIHARTPHIFTPPH